MPRTLCGWPRGGHPDRGFALGKRGRTRRVQHCEGPRTESLESFTTMYLMLQVTSHINKVLYLACRPAYCTDKGKDTAAACSYQLLQLFIFPIATRQHSPREPTSQTMTVNASPVAGSWPSIWFHHIANGGQRRAPIILATPASARPLITGHAKQCVTQRAQLLGSSLCSYPES